MSKIIRQLAVASGLTAGVLGASPALAAGTAAGSTITNTATLNYQVGGVAQTSINASNNITVDRKITLTVAEVGSATTTVVPGSSAQVTSFTVTNSSNDTIDLGLTAAQLSGGTAAHGGTDNFDLTLNCGSHHCICQISIEKRIAGKLFDCATGLNRIKESFARLFAHKPFDGCD